jgi:hypothetical protein
MFMKNLISIMLLIAIITSCSVQKRQYMGGYHITRTHKSQKSEKQLEQAANHNNAQALASNEISVLDLNMKRPTIFDSIPKKVECDTVFFRTGGDKVAAKIIEINTSEVKYRKCSNPDGPLFVVKKSDVVKIRYANGMEEVISAPVTVKEPKPVKDKNKREDQKANKEKESREETNGERKLHPPALMSMIFGIISMPLSFVFIGGVFGVLAILFGNASKKKLKENENLKGMGMAKTGITLGMIGLGIATLFLLLVLLA